MTEIATAIGTNSELGPLTKRVYQFVEAQTRARLAGIRSPSDWDPVAEFIAVDEFRLAEIPEFHDQRIVEVDAGIVRERMDQEPAGP